MNALTVLYRGPLSSCNYGCEYCPFAKRKETADELAADAAALTRFVDWSESRSGAPLRVFFTPWGEALTQRRYQQAIARLSHLPHVQKVAVQTNLSARLDWLSECDASKLGVWATYHPEWTKPARFLEQTQVLRDAGVSFSVGVVGFPQYREALEAMRAQLPADTYLWVNAVKKLSYADDDVAAFETIDPLFGVNLRAHESLGRACGGGSEVISVDGDGNARSCHFIKDVIGNIYADDFEARLTPKPCTAATCGCHIGYVHLKHLGLEQVYGDGILERVPRGRGF